MGLESFTYITSLNSANPVTGDNKTEGDDHLRGTKTVLLNSFPAIAAAVTATHTELNYVDGVTSAIQTQLNAKTGLASPTFTGTTTFSGGGTAEVSKFDSTTNTYVGWYRSSVRKSYIQSSTGGLQIVQEENLPLNFYTNNTTQWSIDGTGRLLNTNNSQPSFRATTAASRTTAGVFITFSESHDYGSNFDVSTGIFTAPVTGVYAFAAQCGCSATSSAGNASFRILVDGVNVRS